MSIRHISIIACILCFAAVSHAAAGATANSVQTDASAIQLIVSPQPGAMIQLEVKQANLVEVLKQIVEKTGVKIHYSVLPDAPVTATCIGATIQQVMRCLVGNQTGLVISDSLPDKPAEFWLLGSNLGSCPAVTAAASEKTAVEPQLTLEEQAQFAKAQKIKSDHYLRQLKNAKNNEQRAQVLSNLATGGNINDPKVRKALDDAITDSDANIRKQAIAALISLDKDGASNILDRGLQDTDEEVRMAVVSYAGKNADVLQQALADSSVVVRDLAAAKLAQIKKWEGR